MLMDLMEQNQPLGGSVLGVDSLQGGLDTGGTSPRFYTRPRPPSRSGPKAPRGGGGGALESRLGSRIVLGCKVDKMGKGNEKNFWAPSAPPYVWPVAVDPWQLSGPGGQGGGGGGGGGVAYQNRGDIPPPWDLTKAIEL